MLVFPRSARSSTCLRTTGHSGAVAKRRGDVVAALAVATLALSAALPGSASAGTSKGTSKGSRVSAKASSSGCVGATKVTKSTARLARTILCLHNVERHKHGLATLHWNNRLARGASAHARDMVRQRYFEHHSPQHKDHMDRLAAVGYGRGAGCWRAGENLLFSRGPTTPQQVLSAWMKSAAHRHNIERAAWRDFGVGTVMASPFGDSQGVTMVVLFGTHSQRPCR